MIFEKSNENDYDDNGIPNPILNFD